MNKFYARAGQFWLNAEPQLIQAGEFHYYRTPKDQWANRLGLLKAAGFNALATYIPWLWHQLDEDVTDLDGHSHPMRDLAGYFDLAAEMGFLIIARPGPYIMAETINEGIPPWVFTKYPQVAFISQDHKVQNVVSYLHPDFLACVKKWYKAIFGILTPRQITRAGRIIMVQLDNEMGMIQWVRNILDTNPNTMTRFAAHLGHVYGTALPDRYPVTDLPDFLRNGILNPREPYAAHIVEDYRCFYRDYLREYATFLLTEAKANGLEVPPVINIHGFGNGGKTFPIGISQLIGVMGIEGVVSATDVYPGHIAEDNIHHMLLVNEMTKALHNKEQPLFSIEFQAGGNQDFGGNQSSLFDLHTRLCISSGMRAINHYLFCDGENDPILSPIKRHDWGHPVRKDGTLRRHYQRYPKLSKVLKVYGADLIRSRPQAVTTIGFQLDYFMTEVNNLFTQGASSIITHQRDYILFDMIARGLVLTHRPFDTLEISRSALDAARTPLLWVMTEKQCDATTQQKLVDYLRSGGKLILAGRMCVEEFSHSPCTILRDALGIKQTEDSEPFVWENITVFDYQDVPVSFVESFTGEFDETFATRKDGGVVGFVKTVGKGQVLVFGATLPANTLGDIDIVHQMAMKMGCPPLFGMSDWADVRISRGENGSFLFINNYQDDPVETTIEYKGKKCLGGAPVHLPARRGAILPVEWRLRDGVTIHYVTSEITEITDDGSIIVLKTDQEAFSAELTLSGYTCAHASPVSESNGAKRFSLRASNGMITLGKVVTAQV
jgi:beta-galactosidase